MKRLQFTALVLIALASAALFAEEKKEEKEEKPNEYTLKDIDKSKEHFDSIIGLVENTEYPIKLSKKANTLEEARAQLKKAQSNNPQRFYACIEYKGWLIFSTKESAQPQEIDKPHFFQGYAVKKGTDQACGFRFCW